MIYTYDKKENAYYEFVSLDDKHLEIMKNNDRVIINDPFVITQIRQIHQGLRRFITIEGNNVKVCLIKLQTNVVEVLKFFREDALKAYDIKLIKLNEEILLHPEKKDEINEKILSIIQKKQKWRDIANHPHIKDAVDWQTYEQVINDIKDELVPKKLINNISLSDEVSVISGV